MTVKSEAVRHPLLQHPIRQPRRSPHGVCYQALLMRAKKVSENERETSQDFVRCLFAGAAFRWRGGLRLLCGGAGEV